MPSNFSSLDQFLKMMAVERKATRSTLSSYDADLRDFYNFFQNKAIEHLGAQDIETYLVAQSHLAKATRARRLSCLRQFYAFLVRDGKTSENPLSHLQLDSYQEKSAALSGKENIKRLLTEAKTDTSGKGKRLSLLLHLYSTSDIPADFLVSLPLKVGLEILKEKSSMLALQNNVRIPLTKETIDALMEYMDVRTEFLVHNQESPWLFPSSSKQGHLTRQRFGQLLKELLKKAA